MHMIYMLFVTIIAAGLIANERRSVVFSQKIRLKVQVCAAFSVIELAEGVDVSAGGADYCWSRR